MKILLIDDSKTMRLLVQVYLMDLKPEFHEAESGTAGLAMAQTVRPDVVIADVQMPGLDGFALCQAIRKSPGVEKTPVLLLTTRTDDAARAEGKRVGCTAFLNKPIAADQLRVQVLAALGLTDTRPGRAR